MEDNELTMLEEFSDLMFRLKYRDSAQYDELMADSEFARFMTMEEDELFCDDNDQMANDLEIKIYYLANLLNA